LTPPSALTATREGETAMTAWIRIAFIALFTSLAASTACAASAYPARPVRFIVPFPAGGGADILARIIGEKLTEAWGQQIVIDNRPGAAGIIGTDIGAKASPDGYTVLLASSNVAITEGMEGRRPYHLFRDLTPVIFMATAPNMLVVNPGVKAKSVNELIALAKARPNPLHFASNGNGSSSHLSAELFSVMAGVKMLHVPYKGGPPGVTATIAGEVQLMFTAILHVSPHAKAGRLRALGVTGGQRSQAAPDVPTIAEQGLPGYESVQWWMVMLPSATAKTIMAKWNSELIRVLGLREVAQRFLSQGAEPVGSTPEEALKYLKSEVAKWTQVTRKLGLRLQ
jgi:tripartite-type tricarboxylate transporter receptor subunit TctC